MKLFWLILAAAPALCLNAQTNSAVPASADPTLWVVPPITLNARTNPPVSGPPAVTNVGGFNATTNTPPRERPPIRIVAEHAVVDMNNHNLVYSSHVTVSDPQMKMTCDSLTVSASTNSSASLRPDGGVAEGHVIIVALDDKGRPINARSDKAIYSYKVANSVTNETVTLTGNVYVDSAMGKGTADPIVWDRINNTIHMENQDMQFQPDIKSGTNTAPAKAVEKFSP